MKKLSTMCTDTWKGEENDEDQVVMNIWEEVCEVTGLSEKYSGGSL